MIISKTAVSHGYGSEPYKWCSGLTRAERRVVRDGHTVVYLDDRLSGGNNGTYLRAAIPTYRGGYTRRVAWPSERREYEALTGVNPDYVPMTEEERRASRAAGVRRWSALRAREEEERFRLIAAIETYDRVTPHDLHRMGKISDRTLATFGIDPEEHQKLIEEKSCVLYAGTTPLIYQGAIEGRGYPHLFVPTGPADSLVTIGWWRL